MGKLADAIRAAAERLKAPTYVPPEPNVLDPSDDDDLAADTYVVTFYAPPATSPDSSPSDL